MNPLKSMDITGYLHSAYGKLTVEYTFENTDAKALAPRYFFSLPENASICGFQLLTPEKNLLRAEIYPITNPCENQSGIRLLETEPNLFCLSFDHLQSGEVFRILIDIFLYQSPTENHLRFTFPIPQGVLCSLALTLEDILPLQCSFPYQYNALEKHLSSSGCDLGDFVLDCSIPEPKSYGLLQESLGLGVGFYRLYPTDIPAKKTVSSIELLLDWNGLSSKQQIYGVKELAFRVFSLLPPDIPIRIPALWEEEVFRTDETLQDFFSALQNLQETDALPYLKNPAQENGLSLLVSGGFSPLPDDFTKQKTVHLFTIGHHRQTPLWKLWQALKMGEVFHCYPKDNPEEQLSFRIAALCAPIENIEIVAKGSNVLEQFSYATTTSYPMGYLDIALSYTGHAPTTFTLEKDGVILETLSPEKVTTFPRFPEAARLFAYGKIKRLTKLKERVSPSSLRAIKSQLAETQMNHQILGTETTLHLPMDLDNSICLPTYHFDFSSSYGISTEKPTIFGESLRQLSSLDRKKVMAYCYNILYQNIRENGGIFSFDTHLSKERAEETALSAIALYDTMAAQSVLQDALTYLSKAPRNRWQFFLQAMLEGKPIKGDLMEALPPMETLLLQLQREIPRVKPAAMLLIHLQA